MTRESFEAALKLLEEKKYPFYVEFLKNFNRDDTRKRFIENVQVFAQELGITSADADDFCAFVTAEVEKRTFSVASRTDKRIKQLEDLGFKTQKHPDLAAVLVRDWDLTRRIFDACKGDDDVRLVFSVALPELEEMIVRFNLVRFAKLVRLLGARKGDQQLYDFLYYGMRHCKGLISRFGLDLFIRLIEKEHSADIIIILRGLSDLADLIDSESGLINIWDILSTIVRDLDSEQARSMISNTLPFFKEKKGFIRSKQDLTEVSRILIAICKACDDPTSASFLLIYGLTRHEEFINSLQDLLKVGLDLAQIENACDKKSKYDEYRKYFFDYTQIFKEFVNEKNYLAIGLDFAKVANACENDEDICMLFQIGLKETRHLVRSPDDFLPIGLDLAYIANRCRKDEAKMMYEAVRRTRLVFGQGLSGFREIITRDNLREVGFDLAEIVNACDDSSGADHVFSELLLDFPIVDIKKNVDLKGLLRILEVGKDNFIPILKRILSHFHEDILEGRRKWKEVEEFVLRLLQADIDFGMLEFILTDEYTKSPTKLDADAAIARIQAIDEDNRYSSCEGLAELGFLSCHVTNAFAGGAALVAGEARREDAFNNIINCISNQGENKFQLSFSTLSPKTSSNLVMTERYGIKGSVGVIFDSGFVYEAYASDASTASKKSKSEQSSFRTGSKFRRIEAGIAVNYSKGRYNELLVRRWTVGGLFYTKGVQPEFVQRLRQIADTYSYRLYPNPAYINRQVAFGVPKEIEKVYPVYEIDTATRTWRIVYTPMKKGTVEEFKELIATATADTCRRLSKKGGISKFIPEWDRFTSDASGWQHAFHDFRLDEYTIKLFEYFDTSDEFKKLQDREQRVLRLTALLHDIAKEGGALRARPRPDPDHPERSAEVVLDILQRLKYDTRTIKIVYRLVYFHNALGNIVIFGDKDAVPVTPERHKVKHSMYDLTKVFFKDEIPLLKILTKADIYALKKNGALLKSDRNFLTLKTRSSIKTEDAIDICAQQIIEWQTTGTMPVEEYRQAA